MDNCAIIRKMFSLYFSTKSTTISMFFQVLETKKKNTKDVLMNKDESMGIQVLLLLLLLLL